MRNRSFLKKLSFILIVLAGIMVGVCAYAGAEKLLPQENKTIINTHFPRNATGETYGSARDVSPYEKTPDLIEAMGINGKIGYIRLNELNGEDPKTPEEALSKQANDIGREINVYKNDGKTVIDKFIIGKVSNEKQISKDSK
jgi:hypothetical protein